jgi:predicted transcriptional regulator
LEPTGEQTTSTNAIYGNKKLKDVAKILASDTREFIPVKDTNDKIVGHINRKMALDVVFGE